MVEIKRKVTIKTKSAVTENETTDSVSLKRKVTLKEKHGVREPPVIPPNGGDGVNGGEGKDKRWLIAIIVIVILTIIGFFLFNHNKTGNGASAESDSTVVDSMKTASSDSTNNVAKDTTEAAAPANVNDKGGVHSNGSPAGSDEDNSTKASQPSSDNGTSIKASSGQTSTKEQANSAQGAVNQTSEVSGSVEQTASDVIKGKYGNGQVRKDKLGSRYRDVQNRVNEMYSQGLVH